MIKIKNQEHNLVLVTNIIREVRGLAPQSGINRAQIDSFRKEFDIKEVFTLPYGKTAMQFVSRDEAERVRLEAKRRREAAEAKKVTAAPAPAASDERFERLLAEVRANSSALNCLIQAHNHQIALLQRVLTTLGADITVPQENHCAASGVTK